MRDWVEGIDYGVVTKADVDMMRHVASATGAVEVDFSEFYCDEDD